MRRCPRHARGAGAYDVCFFVGWQVCLDCLSFSSFLFVCFFIPSIIFNLCFLSPMLIELQSRFGDKPLKSQATRPQLSPKRDCRPKRSIVATYSPFSTAVPLRGQTTQNLTRLFPNRDCSFKRVRSGVHEVQRQEIKIKICQATQNVRRQGGRAYCSIPKPTWYYGGPQLIGPDIIGKNTKIYGFLRVPQVLFNPVRTAAPFWGQTTQNSSSLSLIRDCGPKKDNMVPGKQQFGVSRGMSRRSRCLSRSESGAS